MADFSQSLANETGGAVSEDAGCDPVVAASTSSAWDKHNGPMPRVALTMFEIGVVAGALSACGQHILARKMHCCAFDYKRREREWLAERDAQ